MESCSAEVTPELIDKIRAGDARAFGRYIRIYDDRFRGVVWAILRNREAVDDVMQAAYEKAFRSIGTFDGTSSLRTWLHSICHHAAIDHLRYESRRRHDQLGEDTTAWPDPASGAGMPADLVDAKLQAKDVLGALPPDQRAVLYLTAALGYSFDQTAEITGLKRGTVASRVSRAKHSLRKAATA